MRQHYYLHRYLALIFVLASCTPSPVKVAEGYRIQAQANSDTADAQVERAHVQTINTLTEEQARIETERIAATEAKRRAALNTFWVVAQWCGSIALGASLLMLGYSVARTSYGVAEATVQRAELAANLIKMDAQTRVFPLLRHVHGDKFLLHNPGTGSNIMLDMTREEDRQLVIQHGYVQVTGLLAQEAGKVSNPDGITMVLPGTLKAFAQLENGDQKK